MTQQMKDQQALHLLNRTYKLKSGTLTLIKDYAKAKNMTCVAVIQYIITEYQAQKVRA